MSVTIRVAQVDDSEGMRQCSLRILPAETYPIDRFVRTLSTSPGLSYVAVNNKDEIVGACLVRLKMEVEDAIHAHVSCIFVLHEYQGQGIGRRLLTASLRSARTLSHVSEVTLHVRKSNKPAFALYTSLRFHTTKMKPGHYDDGEDAFAMNLLLRDYIHG